MLSFPVAAIQDIVQQIGLENQYRQDVPQQNWILVPFFAENGSIWYYHMYTEMKTNPYSNQLSTLHKPPQLRAATGNNVFTIIKAINVIMVNSLVPGGFI